MRPPAFAPALDWRPLLGLAALPIVFVVVLLLWPSAVSGQSAPAVTGVAVTSDAGNDATYVLDDVIRIMLTFSEAVEVAGEPRLKIDMDPAEWGIKWAGYESGSGTNSLAFAYTVVDPNKSTQGIAVLADSLELNDGAIRSAVSETDADLSHAGLAHDASHKVDWEASPPTVTGVAVTSDAGDDDTYGLDDVIQITVTFSEAVEVSGSPQLAIDMDPAEWGTKWAGYASGSGTATLVFTHTVVEPNVSTQGIAVLADTLALSGGTMLSVSSQIDANLSHPGLAHDAEHKVDWQQSPPPTIPTVTAVAISSDAGDDDTYALHDVIHITVTLSEAVEVTGSPQLQIDMDPGEWGEKPAGYHSGSGTASLVFAHTVVEPNISTQGIAVLADTLALNGGTIQSASSQIDANLAHSGLDHDAEHKVDWQQADPNQAPVVNAQAANYPGFVGQQNAPRGILVSKPFHGLFSDPDGDELTYTVSVASGNGNLVESLQVMRHQDVPEENRVNREEGLFSRVWFTADAADDWKAISRAVPDPLVVTVTLAATDPGGLSASVPGDFLVNWESQPEVVSAVASKQAIALTFDLAVDATSVPKPEQFTVNVANADGTTGTIAVSKVTVNGSVVTLELASELAEGQAVTLDYAEAADTPLQRAGGGDPAPGFSGQVVDTSRLEPPPRSASRGYRGQLGEVLVELSLRRPARATDQARGGARGAGGPSADSAHTTSIVYVIDDSGSMDGDFPEVRTALKDVRGTTMANTKVALIKFGTEATTVFGLTDHSTSGTSGPWTDARINSFGGKLGGTYYRAPLQNAKALLDADSATTTKKIIFLTDAQGPRPTVIQSIIDANNANGDSDVDIVVDTIGFGDHYSGNFDVIQQIATDTGGAYRAVAKPSQGTTNSPAVAAKSMTEILKGAVADNTATLFLVDQSFSVYRENNSVVHPALTAAATKAGESSGTGRKVGLAVFLGETTLFKSATETPKYQKYQVLDSIGSSSLSIDDTLVGPTGSTNLDHALSQAYSAVTASSVTATSKRVVLITDGISAAKVQTATLNSYKNNTSVTLDVVAWGAHADRVQLKTWADSASGTFNVAKVGPDAPEGIEGISGSATIAVTWTDPMDSTITKYQYRYKTWTLISWMPWSDMPWSEWMDMPGSGASTTRHIFAGLTNYAWYFIEFRALRGDETPGPATARYARPMASSMGLTATAGNGEIALSWTDPGDSDITKYQYAQRTANGAWSDWTDIPSSSATTTSHTITGLTNGTSYTIALWAVKGAGDAVTYTWLNSVTATPVAPSSG